jgi:hypothetical protein
MLNVEVEAQPKENKSRKHGASSLLIMITSCTYVWKKYTTKTMQRKACISEARVVSQKFIT